MNSDFVYEKWYYFQSAAFILREITNYFVSNDTSYSFRIHTVCMLLELETSVTLRVKHCLVSAVILLKRLPIRRTLSLKRTFQIFIFFQICFG